MISKSLLFCTLVFFVLSCRKPETIVNYTLSDEQLSHLMFDVQLGEVAVSEQDNPARRDSLRTAFWQKLTVIYKLPEDQLIAEVRKLEADPEKMKLIMDRAQVLADSIR